MADYVSRSTVEHEARHQRFVLKQTDYVQQFCHMYSRRLAKMRGPLIKAATEKWQLSDGSSTNVKVLDRIIDSEGMPNETCVLIGTIYKEMALKPSVLDEYKEKNGILGGSGAPKEVKNFASTDDSLLLEDESGRARLVGMEKDAAVLVTGVTVALKGMIKPDGSFQVEDWLRMGDYLPPATSKSSAVSGEPRYVLFASGLEVGAKNASLPAIQMFVDFVCGKLGGPEQKELSSRIVRVVLAGNSMGESPARLSGLERFTDADATKRNKQEIDDFFSSSSRHLDALVSQMAVTCPVDIMPGSTDPTNVIMPQQPIHRCMLPMCTRLNTTELTTNPYESALGGRVLVGHSGQPLMDMLLQVPVSTISDENNDDNSMETDATHSGESQALQMLVQSLRWGHLCPTAPDSLACYPYLQEDPFVMEELPDVVFAGGMHKFETTIVEDFSGHAAQAHRTRVVCVPSFKLTREVVLVDLVTLDTKVVSFGQTDL